MGLFEDIDFNNLIESFADIGGFDVVLPFLLIFAITFAILRKITLFGNNKNVDLVVSAILGIFLVSSTSVVELIQNFLPRVSMIVLVILMLILVVGIFSGSATWGGGWLFFGAIIAIIAVLWALGAAADWDVPLFEDITEQDIGTLIVIGVFVLVIWLIVREPGGTGSDPNKGPGSALTRLGNSLKGGNGEGKSA